MHWKCNFIESISVFISLFVCLFSFLLIELILNNVICKFYIQHVDIAMGIIEKSYGEDLHYLLWRMAALCSFSCISGGKCENSWGCTDLVPLMGKYLKYDTIIIIENYAVSKIQHR